MSEITILRRIADDTVVLSVDVLGAQNTVYVTPSSAEICLDDWYGHTTHAQATKAIDSIIVLLEEAKRVIEQARAAQAGRSAV